ncbi:MAG: cation diffusion facilitator family transporter [Propionibacteriaceae bacterium]
MPRADSVSLPATSSGGGESVRTVLIAFGANLLIAIAKSVAAGLTGSAAMLAEAAHSWADTGNEIFLLFAQRRGDRERDASHPMGYGRESYVWSMFAAFGLFTAGAVVSIWHGVTELLHPGQAQDFLVAYVVLAVAFVLEGISFLQAFRQAHRQAERLELETLEHVLQSSDSTLRAVFAEDAAALVGLVIAALGVGLHQLTGSVVPDALGSIAVGVLLGVVAVILIDRNRRFLVGVQIPAGIREQLLGELLKDENVDRVTYLHAEFVGSARLYVVAAVDIIGDEIESGLARRLRAVEARLEAHPNIEEAVITLSTSEEPSLT